MEERKVRQQGWARAALTYACVALPVAFLWLGTRDVHVMEGIIADGARYMDRTGELSVPHLHGEVYNYKPPGAYWMALASVKLIGAENEWTLRFPFALSGVLMGIGVLWLAGQVLGPSGGLRCAVVALTGGLVLDKLHLAEWDVALAAGVGLATAVASRNFALPRAHPALWSVGYLGLAFGFLVKGTLALVLFFPGLVAAAILTHRVRELLRPAHLAGVALFGLLAAGWILTAAGAEGWGVFAQPFMEAGEKGLRWTWPALGRAFARPLVVVILFLPWTITLPLIARARWWRELTPQERLFAQSAAAFAVVGVLLLTIIPTRETRYFLPLTVPVALLCGLAMEPRRRPSVWSRTTEVIAGGLAVFAGVAITTMASIDALAGDAGRGTRLLTVAVGLATIGIVVTGFLKTTRRGTFSVLLTAVFCYWVVNTLAIEPGRAERRSLRSVAEAFEPYLGPGETVWTTPVASSFHHSSLFFYLRRPVRTVTETARPASGSHVVLFSDEPYDRPEYRLPLDYSVVAASRRRGIDFVLARVD